MTKRAERRSSQQYQKQQQQQQEEEVKEEREQQQQQQQEEEEEEQQLVTPSDPLVLVSRTSSQENDTIANHLIMGCQPSSSSSHRWQGSEGTLGYDLLQTELPPTNQG